MRTFAWVFQYSQFVLIKFKRFSTGNTLIMCDVTIGHSRNSHTELSTIKNFHLLYKQIFSLEILQYKKRLQSAYDTFFFFIILLSTVEESLVRATVYLEENQVLIVQQAQSLRNRGSDVDVNIIITRYCNENIPVPRTRFILKTNGFFPPTNSHD